MINSIILNGFMIQIKLPENIFNSYSDEIPAIKYQSEEKNLFRFHGVH